MNDSCGDSAGLARTRSVARVMYLPPGVRKVVVGARVRCWVVSPVAQLRTSCKGPSADFRVLRAAGWAAVVEASVDTGRAPSVAMMMDDPHHPPAVPARLK